MQSPFPPSQLKPGHGEIHLTLLPPATPSFSTLTYTYPLKLLPSTPHLLASASSSVKDTTSTAQPIATTTASDPAPSAERKNDNPRPTVPRPANVPLLFLLTYGGGLIAGDAITLRLKLDAGTRLAIATQGSTKVYRPAAATAPVDTSSTTTTTTTIHLNPPATPPITRQDLVVRIGAGAALWLAPDPVQPFAESVYAQSQVFNVERGASLGMVDWVSEGRTSRGEVWNMKAWKGRNEIWSVASKADDDDDDDHSSGGGGGGDDGAAALGQNSGWENGKTDKHRSHGKREHRSLLVRDAVVLEGRDVRARMDGMGCFGTLLLRGPLFEGLGEFFLAEFAAMPRIGGRSWDLTEKEEREGDEDEEEEKAGKRFPSEEAWRKQRVESEKKAGVLWTACRVRGVFVVKFSSREVEGARRWLGDMLGKEGMIREEFGDGGMMFVR